MNSRKQYSTEKAVSATLRIILISVIIFAVCTLINVYAEKDWDIEYQMTNAKVEWTGAGHSGIWGGK